MVHDCLQFAYADSLIADLGSVLFMNQHNLANPVTVSICAASQPFVAKASALLLHCKLL